MDKLLNKMDQIIGLQKGQESLSREIIARITILENRVDLLTTTSVQEEEEKISGLPVATKTDLDNLEIKLKDDKLFKRAVVSVQNA